MYCPICGKDIDDGSTFCPECNNSIELPEGMDDNLPSQIYNNKNHLPDDYVEEDKAGKKKSVIAGTIATIAVVVAVVLCIVFLSVKKIVEKQAKVIPVSAVSASMRKTMFETTGFKMSIEIKDLEQNISENMLFMVSYGENAEDTDFYYDDGVRTYACLDGVGYDAMGETPIENIWADLDLVATMALGSEFKSKDTMDALVDSGLSEAEFENLFNTYRQILFAYFMNTGTEYMPVEYDDIQVVFTKFLNGGVSKDALTIEGKDGKYTFTVNTEAFLTEFFAFAEKDDVLSEHYEYFGFGENKTAAEDAIAYYATEIPQISGTVEVDSDGYITKANVKVADSYEAIISVSDINNTVIDKSLCENIEVTDVVQDTTASVTVE